MAYPTPEQNPNTNSDDDDRLPPLPEPLTENSNEVAGEVRYAQAAPQPWWMKWSPYVLIAWALWFAFWGGEGLFHVEQSVNLFFSGIVILWAVYHILAPRFKWPGLPLG